MQHNPHGPGQSIPYSIQKISKDFKSLADAIGEMDWGAKTVIVPLDLKLATRIKEIYPDVIMEFDMTQNLSGGDKRIVLVIDEERMEANKHFHNCILGRMSDSDFNAFSYEDFELKYKYNEDVSCLDIDRSDFLRLAEDILGSDYKGLNAIFSGLGS